MPFRGLACRRMWPAVLGVILAIWCLAGVSAPAVGQASTRLPDQVRVAIALARSTATVGGTGPCELVDRNTGTVLARSSGGDPAFALKVSAGVIQVPGGLHATGAVLVRPVDGGAAHVTLFGRPYRGTLEVAVGTDGLMIVINQVDLESYLLGVVPQEMPASWPEEALKAQAVAARTYAAMQVNSARAAGAVYDLLATTDSQVYGGVESEQALTTCAVAATQGVVITYDGNLVGAYYHSSSGGHTENSENIWVSYSPYLRGVPDYDQASPKYNWERDMSVDEVSTKLATAGIQIGRVVAVEPSAEVGASGRPLTVTFTGSSGSVTIKSEEARRVLGLPSSWFEVKVDSEGAANLVGYMQYGDEVVVAGAASGAPNRQVRRVGQPYCLSYEGMLWRIADYTVVYNRVVAGRVRFEGHGWGHGVGLSQWGARELATRGWSFGDILCHYYTGVALERW